MSHKQGRSAKKRREPEKRTKKKEGVVASAGQVSQYSNRSQHRFDYATYRNELPQYLIEPDEKDSIIIANWRTGWVEAQ